MVGELDPERFRSTLSGATPEFEVEALSHQIVILSRNVTAKHKLVDVGFGLAGLTLILFVAALASYVQAVS